MLVAFWLLWYRYDFGVVLPCFQTLKNPQKSQISQIFDLPSVTWLAWIGVDTFELLGLMVRSVRQCFHGRGGKGG
jgi:abortive infection bacteriophage resistance protein